MPLEWDIRIIPSKAWGALSMKGQKEHEDPKQGGVVWNPDFSFGVTVATLQHTALVIGYTQSVQDRTQLWKRWGLCDPSPP